MSWNCKICTLINNAEAKKCEVCNASGPNVELNSEDIEENSSDDIEITDDENVESKRVPAKSKRTVSKGKVLKSAPLSEFELKRQERIRVNMEEMAKLGYKYKTRPSKRIFSCRDRRDGSTNNGNCEERGCKEGFQKKEVIY